MARRYAGEPADPEIVRRIAAGDLAALSVLYDRHHESVRRFFREATANTADADDLTHETLLIFAQVAAKYDGRPSARSFLLGIARQLIRRRRRRRYRDARALTLLAATASQWRAPTPEEGATVTEETRLLNQALDRLPEGKRRVFLLVERQGASAKEVAAALQVPVGTVWARLHHARVALRRALAPDDVAVTA